MSEHYPRLGQTGGWLSRFAALCSQLINLTFCNGSPDETLSGRCYRQGVIQNIKGWNRARKVVNFLFFWESDHCCKSHAQDKRAAESLRTLYQFAKAKL